MGIVTTITCDTFEKDITSTDAMPRYRLKLTPQSLPHEGNFINAVMTVPPIERTMYFCNVDCLKKNEFKGRESVPITEITCNTSGNIAWK